MKAMFVMRKTISLIALATSLASCVSICGCGSSNVETFDPMFFPVTSRVYEFGKEYQLLGQAAGVLYAKDGKIFVYEQISYIRKRPDPFHETKYVIIEVEAENPVLQESPYGGQIASLRGNAKRIIPEEFDGHLSAAANETILQDQGYKPKAPSDCLKISIGGKDTVFSTGEAHDGILRSQRKTYGYTVFLIVPATLAVDTPYVILFGTLGVCAAIPMSMAFGS